MPHDSQAMTQPTQRRDLDLLGMWVVFGLVLFHTAMVFYPGFFWVKNEPPSMEQLDQMVALAFVSFAGLWGMPLMFLLAGSAIWYSLRKRTAGEFVRERIRRLFVPLLTGLLVIAPPQVYYQLKADPTYSETFAQFYRRFFDLQFALDFPLFIKGAPPDELFHPTHLYFLIYLFAFTLLLLPLFLYLRSPAGQHYLERLAGFCSRAWTIFLLALPVAAIEAALTTQFGGGWNRYAYIPFIAYGFLIAADARFRRALHAHWKRALVLGVLSFIVYFLAFGALRGVAGVDPWTDYSVGSVLWRLLKGIASWFWIVAIMGWAGRRSQATGKQVRSVSDSVHQSHPQLHNLPGKPLLIDRLAEYAGEAQLPFYVLHELPIVVIGFYVVQWQVNTLVKYLVIVVSSLVVTLVLYDIGVRRTRWTRFLFGMRPKQGSTQ